MDDEKNVLIGVFSSHVDAEKAVKVLSDSAFDMTKLSIIGKDYHPTEHVVGFYNAGDRVASWGKCGAFWGFIWGLICCSGLFFIPGVGTVMVGGPIVSLLVSALEGAVIVGGLSALGAALYSIGVPKHSILKYEKELQADKFLLVVHGTPTDVAYARDVLTANSIQDVDIFEQLSTNVK